MKRKLLDVLPCRYPIILDLTAKGHAFCFKSYRFLQAFFLTTFLVNFLLVIFPLSLIDPLTIKQTLKPRS